MRVPTNQFKQSLRNGRTQYGMWLGIPDTTVAEIGAGAGFDWVVIDAEHGPFDLNSILLHLQAMAPYPVAPIVRPVEGNAALIKQLLDIGAQTLLVPMVDTAEQASGIVRAAYYPPVGIRGMGTSLARAARWNRIGGYANQANEEICIVAQIESTIALDNLEEIVAVEGIDAVFIGPADLSASMGHVGDSTHPDVTQAIHVAFETVLAAGKPVGILALSEELASGYVRKGASFIGVGVDTALLSQATRNLAAQYIDLAERDDIAGY